MANARDVWDKIFTDPVPSDLGWDDIEDLFAQLGGTVTRGSSGRTRVDLNGGAANFLPPLQTSPVPRPTILDVRRFLISTGAGRP
jgi:hypothetical protein